MCGISGWVNFDENVDLLKNEETIIKMRDSVIHRGPEECGLFTSRDALFGHRRLCVIDAEGGKQPMVYKDGEKSIALTYNGELYNYQDLRLELQALGHTFKSESDTEVILMSYVEWGEECAKKFNGMFAVAVYDEKKSRLFLARDHLGVKPLFYCTRGSSILFGSEIKVLLANDLVDPIVDQNGVAQLFYLGAFRTPETGCVFKDVHELAAGKHITFNRSSEGESFFTTKGEIEYWNLQCQPHSDDLISTEKKVRQLLKSCLSKQLVADVPITFLLTGGLASSILVSLASSLAKSSSLPDVCPLDKTSILKTFSCEFENDEKDYLETIEHPKQHWVEKVVGDVQTEHHKASCSVDDLLQTLMSPMRARDLPCIGKDICPLRLMLKKVKQHGVVLLSDAGSDEIFSGYDHYFKKESALNQNVLPWIGDCFVGLNEYLKQDVLNAIDYKKYNQDIYNEAIKNIPLLPGENEYQTKQRIQSWLFIKYFLIYMLEREDRTSMSNSLEIRVPYCDYKLVEYCWNIPYNLKSIDDIEKGILRRSMINQLPKDILYHQRAEIPTTVQNKDYFIGISNILLSIIKDSNSPILKFINNDSIMKLLSNKDKHENQTHQNQILIEYLIQVNNWIMEYKVKFI